ncbi:MAG: hypothetical protein ACI35M_05390 [Alistipes sp.]
MDYIIALYRLRTSGMHTDLAECGLAGFRPFEVETDLAVDADCTICFGEKLELEQFAGFCSVYDFQFEENYADCHFGRYDGGHLFYMQRGDNRMLFVKADGESVVRCNMGAGAKVDTTMLRFGLWMMFGLVITPLGGIAIHSSVIVKDGGAVLCLGESGTGKSTHTRLWRENIEGARLLNDDSPIIRTVDGVPTVFGSAWSGKTPCYINRSFPIRGFIRLSQAPHNRIKQLNVLNAIGALLPSCPPAFAYDDQLQDSICNTLSQMIAHVPVYHLECLPDADAARLSYNTIYNRK